MAAALDIAGGQIGIFKVSEYNHYIIVTSFSLHHFDIVLYLQLTHAGRQDTDEVLMFQNSANVMDFVFDPFNNHRLVVGNALIIGGCSISES